MKVKHSVVSLTMVMYPGLLITPEGFPRDVDMGGSPALAEQKLQ